MEDIRLAQMAKLKWKVDGDHNFTFFYACLVNKRWKHISDMRAMDEVVFDSPWIISPCLFGEQGAMDCFSGFLQADLSRDLPDLAYLISPVIYVEENVRIYCTPTMDEVFVAISSIPTSSSLRPDGFGASFFKSCLEIVRRTFGKQFWIFFSLSNCQDSIWPHSLS